MKSTKIKICGITRKHDLSAAIAAGADAVGFVFYGKSPRCVSPSLAAELITILPPFVSPVALFVNPDRSEVDAVLALAPMALLQFHGDEDEAFCKSFNRPYLKAIRVKEGVDVAEEAAKFSSAQGILLDSWSDRGRGGTGERFDLSLVKRGIHQPLILAGGLSSDNALEVISKLAPYAVDVSSGVELELEPGIKSAEKINDFIAAVRAADKQLGE